MSQMIRLASAAFDAVAKPNIVRHKPIHMQFEPTSYCNLACAMCSHSVVVKKPRHLSYDSFVRVFDQAKPTHLTFSGLGEPLLNPRFFDMVAYAAEHGAVVNTTSNGTLFNSAKILEKVVASKLTLISVSLDAANAATYLAVRKEDYFDRIVKGLRDLVRMRDEAGRKDLPIRLCFCISQMNIAEIPAFTTLAADVGADLAFFQVMRLYEDHEADKGTLVGDMSKERYATVLKEAQVIAKARRFPTNIKWVLDNLDRYWQHYEGKEDKKICPLPWFSIYVDVDAHIRPCCQFCAESSSRMGPSLNDVDLDEVWNSKRYQGFRKAIAAGKRPYKTCQTCIPETLGDMAMRTVSRFSPGFM